MGSETKACLFFSGRKKDAGRLVMEKKKRTGSLTGRGDASGIEVQEGHSKNKPTVTEKEKKWKRHQLGKRNNARKKFVENRTVWTFLSEGQALHLHKELGAPDGRGSETNSDLGNNPKTFVRVDL